MSGRGLEGEEASIRALVGRLLGLVYWVNCSIFDLLGAWYSMGALIISVPALLGYLQEVCRAQLPESELMRRKYHSVRQEDLQRVRLSRPEAVAEVKSL